MTRSELEAEFFRLVRLPSARTEALRLDDAKLAIRVAAHQKIEALVKRIGHVAATNIGATTNRLGGRAK